jgi:hypothetical protein
LRGRSSRGRLQLAFELGILALQLLDEFFLLRSIELRLQRLNLLEEGDGVRGRLLQLGVRCFPFCTLVQRFITKQPKALIGNSQRVPVCAAS